MKIKLLAAALLSVSICTFTHADTFSNVEIQHSAPFLDFDDTDNGGTDDWSIVGYTTHFGVYDYATSDWVLYIDRVNNNANSFRADSNGDISLADNAIYIDRSTSNLGIGTISPGYSIDIHSIVPEIELYDETDNTSTHLQYNNGEFAIEGNNEQDMVEVIATAPESSLFIDGTGNVGLGTSSPATNLNIFGSGAFADIGLGDSSNTNYWNIGVGFAGLWFSNATTGGSAAPFKLSRLANNNSLVVAENNNIGIGTDTPSVALEISRDDGTARFEVNETSAVSAPRTLFTLSNPGNTKFSLNNTTKAVEWAFANPGSGFRVSRQGSGVVEFDLLNNGNLTIAGTLTENSDRNAKTEIMDVDSQVILDKVTALPIKQWQYKDALGENHIGPMAQDFYAAFGLGSNEKGIATLDSSGVALASIQALAKQNREIISRSQRIEQENALLKAQVAELRQQQKRLLQLEQVVIKLQRQTEALPLIRATTFNQ